ncbi:uncharacterized protein LOC144865173 [Branchiostoma floridae x Branchiostoma japonicum]
MSEQECSAVLLINDQYGTSTTNRQVAQIITGAGRKVYSAVVKATLTDRKYAKTDGVELILPTCSEGDTRKPSLDWLTFDHRTRYPSLPQDVRCIVGHADVTSKAAVAFKELRFPQADLGLVIGTIPEDTEKYKDEEKAMGIGGKEESIRQDAEKADTVFSVGHRIHDHITNSFRAIPEDKRPTHHLFLPKPSDLFQKTTVEFRETKEKVVLSIGGVNMVERLKGHDLTAKSLAKVAERSLDRILWRVCNISKEEYQASMDILQACIDSGKLKPTLFTEDTQEDICRHMQQAHLVLMPSRAEPFGLVGLEAMAAGVPVLVSDQSGLATLVDKVIPEFHHSVVEIEGNDSVDVARWAGQIEKVLRKSKAEFSRAAELKAKLLKSRYWEESHKCFLQACGGAGTYRNVERTTPDQALEDPRSARLAAGNPDLPVHLHLGMVQQPTATGAAVDIHLRLLERILELERTLFTIDVLRDPGSYEKTRQTFLSHKALLKDAITGSFILLLTFLRQTDVDRFYHNHYRVGEGSLSQQLSHILISEHLQDKVKGAQLIVRLQVKHEDYVRVRERLGRGLSHTTSVDNLLALPSPSKHMDRSSLRGLDLAVIGREDKSYTNVTDDITTLYRQVQSAVQTTREKSKQQAKVLTGKQGDALRRKAGMPKERDEQKLLLELKEEIQQLKETNKSKDARIRMLLAAKQPIEGGYQKKDPVKKQDTGEETATFVDNPTILAPPSKPEDRSSLRGLSREDQHCTDETDDITTLYRQVLVQSNVQTTRAKSEKILLDQRAEMEVQELQETNKNMEATIEEMLRAKLPVESGSQQKHPLQPMSDKLSMDKSTTGQGEQLVVQPQGEDTVANVRSIRVRKVKFGGRGSGKGKFLGPHGVAVSQDNEVYISDWWNSRIQVFTMDGVYIREFITTLPGETGEVLKPHDVAADRNDNLWVVGDDHIVQYSREGTYLAKIDLPHVEWRRGITIAKATEQVIVTEYDGQNGRLRVFAQNSYKVYTYDTGHMSPEPWFPCYVTVDGEGNILVTDTSNYCVHVLDRDGNFKFKFGSEGSEESQLKHPRDICVDGMGNIIVADYGNGSVKMFDSQGRFLSHIGSGMESPWAVAVSPGGDVVVTEYGNDTVSVWTQLVLY